MHQQRVAGVERNKQILAAAIDRADSSALEARCKSPRKGLAQILAPQQQVLDPGAAHRWFKLPTDGFDLGQFRHQPDHATDRPSARKDVGACCLRIGNPEEK